MKAPGCKRSKAAYRQRETSGARSVHPGKYVSYAANRPDEAWPAIELLPQMADVHIEKAIVGRGLALKQRSGDLVARDDAPRGSNKHLQQIELRRGEFDPLPGAPHFARRRVNANGSDRHFGCRLLDHRLAAPQHGANPRQQFIGIKWLGKIVVGAGIEALDAILLLYARRRHDHGDALAPPQLLEHSESVEYRQHDIENHQVMRAIHRAGQPLAPVVGALKPMAGLGKILPHHAAQLGVVVDE